MGKHWRVTFTRPDGSRAEMYAADQARCTRTAPIVARFNGSVVDVQYRAGIRTPWETVDTFDPPIRDWHMSLLGSAFTVPTRAEADKLVAIGWTATPCFSVLCVAADRAYAYAGA